MPLPQPEHTYAIVIGIERYAGAEPLPYAASVAVRFASWLAANQVPRSNIAVALSPRLAGRPDEAVLASRLAGWNVREASLASLMGLFTDGLAEWRAPTGKVGLLIVFWAGHGAMTSDEDRRLLPSDYTDVNRYCVSVRELSRYLGSPESGVENCMLLVDSCANWGGDDLAEFRFACSPGRLSRQLRLFSSLPGQTATFHYQGAKPLRNSLAYTASLFSRSFQLLLRRHVRQWQDLEQGLCNVGRDLPAAIAKEAARHELAGNIPAVDSFGWSGESLATTSDLLAAYQAELLRRNDDRSGLAARASIWRIHNRPNSQLLTLDEVRQAWVATALAWWKGNGPAAPWPPFGEKALAADVQGYVDESIRACLRTIGVGIVAVVLLLMMMAGFAWAFISLYGYSHVSEILKTRMQSLGLENRVAFQRDFDRTTLLNHRAEILAEIEAAKGNLRPETETSERLKQRQNLAELLMVAARSDAPAPLFAALADNENPTLRTYLVHHLSASEDPGTIWSWIKARREAADADSVHALLVALGLADLRKVASAVSSDAEQLASLRDRHCDPGVRSATRWLLQRLAVRELDDAVSAAASAAHSPPRCESETSPYPIEFLGRPFVAFPANQEFRVRLTADPGDQAAIVVIPRSFAIACHEVTRRQFGAPTPVAEGDLPLVGVPWIEAARFCNRLSDDAGFTPVYEERNGRIEVASDALRRDGFRLPTALEWELACRAGSATKCFYGNDPLYACAYLHCTNAGSTGALRAVGLPAPNRLGLFDMYGNAEEWCHNAPFARSLLISGVKHLDQAAEGQTDHREIRGRGAQANAAVFSSIFFVAAPENTSRAYSGFRLARTLHP